MNQYKADEGIEILSVYLEIPPRSGVETDLSTVFKCEPVYSMVLWGPEDESKHGSFHDRRLTPTLEDERLYVVKLTLEINKNTHVHQRGADLDELFLHHAVHNVDVHAHVTLNLRTGTISIDFEVELRGYSTNGPMPMSQWDIIDDLWESARVSAPDIRFNTVKNHESENDYFPAASRTRGHQGSKARRW
jgi:hypothetical protein